MTTPPPETFFVGRDRELAEITLLLTSPSCRLLTLVGPGGIGKTRLALETARQLKFANGVHFVALQPLSSPDFILSAIAEAVGFLFDRGSNPKQQLLGYFRDKSVLLILDNLEHLLDGIPLVTEMLAAAPGLRILATSRERLNLREEWVLEVGGLSYPTQEVETEIEHYSAAELFILHASRTTIGFSLSDAVKLAVIRICRLVGGMPLAIELAAAWVRVLSCEAIADEIERSLDFLETSARDTEPRHRSMRAVIDPTWNRMSEQERAVFGKVSVFHGGFSREAAEAVAGASLQILSALVDKSLLRVGETGRYEIHELLRQYGEEQLVRAGNMDRVRGDHGIYFMSFLSQREPDIKGRRQLGTLNEVDADFENIRAGWHWMLSSRNYRVLDRALETLFLFCETRGRFHDGVELLSSAQAQLAVESADELRAIRGRIRTRHLRLMGWNEYSHRDAEKIRDEVEEWLALARYQGDQTQIAFCLWLLSVMGYFTQDYAGVTPLMEACLALYSDLEDRFYMARTADWLAILVGSNGQMEEFYRLSQYSLDLRRAIGDRFGTASSLVNLARRALDDGHYQQAKHHVQEIGHIYEEIGGAAWMIRPVSFLSQIAFQEGDFQETRARAEEALEIAKLGDFVADGMVNALTMLSMLAALEEDYARSWALCESARHNLLSANSTREEASAVAACGLENYPAARHYFLEAVNLSFPWHDYRGMTLMLPIAAILLDHAGQRERAVELLGLAFHHPASAKAWMEQWPLLTRLRTQLEAELGLAAYTAAWERGKHADLMAVTAGLLNHFQMDQESPALHAANRALIEPLSPRELEVLQGIAAGLTNAEIAGQMVVQVSTVKKHISHLYDKLGVKTRTQVLVRARELDLL